MDLASMNSKQGTVIRYFLVAIVCMLLLPLFSSGDIKNGEQSDVRDTPIQKKQLKTIIVDNYYPYTFVNQNGDPDGFSVDLIRTVAQEMGLELKIAVDTWDQARNALENGDIDVLPMMAYSKERDRVFDFSVPHTIAYDAFFTRKNGSKVRSLNDLRGKKIIVMKNDQAHDYLRSTGRTESQQLILIDSLPDALRLLSSGKGDAALMPKLVGLIVAKNLKLNNLELSPIVIEDYKRPFSFAVAEGNQSLLERLSQGLSIVKASDQYSNIYEKWFVALEPSGLPLRTVLKYVGGIILVSILIASVLLLWSFSLKRQVALRTRTLDEEIAERKQAEEALRESEEKYRRIFENSVVGFFQSTPEGRFINVNPAFAKMLRYESSEDLVTSISDIATQYYVNPKDRKQYQKVLHQNGRVDGFEFKVQRKDGSEIWVSNSTRAYFDKDGEVVLYEGIVIDITERKRLEDQLRQSQKLESIGTLAGGIAHDFNNILSPIMIHSEMAKMELAPDSPVQHNLKEIFKAGMRATDMVKQILTFSRKKEGEWAVIKITPVLKEVLKMLRSSIPTTIDIQQNLESESDTVLADPTQIHQILLNLGTNAAHAMREKGGTLKVSLVLEDLDSEAAAQYTDLNPGSYLKLTVSDTGSGIDVETMKRIFEPYFTTKEVGEGTGMGLALIHGIVKIYAGDITVESELGKGTTFNVYLPRVEADVAPVEERSSQIPRGTERILFVDDEKVAVDAIQPLLETLGYKVIARTSSIEALEAFKNDPTGFDLVITDQTMPNMTGKDLAKEIMSIRSDIPIILCTGFSEQIDEVTAKEMGISFLMKPIVLSQIANTIRKVLDKK